MQTLAKDGTASYEGQICPQGAVRVRGVEIIFVKIPNGSKPKHGLHPMGRHYVVMMMGISNL